MDEESRRERILLGPSSVFPQEKAGSKGCRETSVEARLLQGVPPKAEILMALFILRFGLAFSTFVRNPVATK
jgi:hypothetical protein